MKRKKRYYLCSRLLSVTILLLVLAGLYSPPVVAAEVNLAYQPDKNGINTVEVTASYKKSDSVPGAVFDGIKNESGGVYKWYVPASNATDAWISVDLKASYPVSSVKVYSAFADSSTTTSQDTLTDFEVYYSAETVSDPTDASKFQLLGSKTGADGVAELKTAPTEARTIKLVSKNTKSFRIREIEIFGDPGESSKFVTNIALGKKLVSSYDNAAAEALSVLTDGITSETSGKNIYYVGANNADGAWINIDLEKVYLVQGIRIYSSYNNGTSGIDKLNNFDLCGTAEPVTDPAADSYTTLSEIRGMAAGLAEITLEEPTAIRNLKLLSHNTSAFRIREIEILGKTMPELPVATLLSPVDGETVGVSQPFTVSAQVTKEKSEISEVRFYLNDEILEGAPAVNDSTYSLTVPGQPAGIYTVRVEAENVDGGIGKSEPATVTVTDYALSGLRFTDGSGKEISALPSGGKVRAELSLSSFSGEPLKDAFFCFALFNTNTKMMEASQYQYFDLEGGGKATLTAELNNLPQQAENYCVRGFFWRGVNDMRPICDPIFFGASKPVIGAVSFDKSAYKNDEDILCSVPASDPFTGIGGVVFYVDGTKIENIATEKNGVYTVNLGSRYSGSYQVTARAVNTQGISVTSAPATVTVTGYDYDPDEIVLEVLDNAFNVYVKGSLAESNQYAKYHFKHIVDSGTNANLYRIFRSYAARRTGEVSFEVMYGGAPVIGEGEWEFAAQEVGAADFIGGYHGDELLSGVSLSLDGTSVNLNEPGVQTGQSVTFIQDSMLNRCDTPHEDVARHQKNYTVTKDGITLTQKIDWLKALTLKHGYVAMLPVNRKAGATQLTHKVQVLDPEGKVFDVPEKNSQTSGIELTKEQFGVKKVKAWGEETGIEVTLENQMGETLEGANFLMMVRDNDNKFYFDYCWNYTTQIGEIWNNTGKYRIDLKK